MSDKTTGRKPENSNPSGLLLDDKNSQKVDLQSGELPDPDSIPLEDIDVSDSRLFQQDAWRPYFERLRNENPIHLTQNSPFGPYWSITCFEDIMHVESRHDIFSSFPTIAIGDSPNGQYIENFISMDPPKHDQQRMAVAPAVAPRNLARLESQIRHHACEILDSIPNDGIEFDWVDQVSVELTTRMLATLFDFPFDDRRKLTYWSDISIGSPETTGMDEGPTQEEVMVGLNDMATTFMGLWAERASVDPEGKTDLITMLAHGKETKDMINNPLEFLGNIMLLIVGGNDTTRNSITGGVLGLNQFPKEYEKLRENLSLIPNMVSEIVRWQTPVIHMRRTLLEDYKYKGQEMKAGDKVVLWYISGNRDETIHKNADQLIIDRVNPRHHVSFGFGIHRCMGNRLAEMQLRVIWEEIMQRFEKIEVVGAETRLKSNFIRGIKTLPVKVTRK